MTNITKKEENIIENVIETNILAIFLLFNAINAIDIYQNQVSRGTINLSIGAITIHSGAYWSIIDNAISALVGTLTCNKMLGFISLDLIPSWITS